MPGLGVVEIWVSKSLVGVITCSNANEAFAPIMPLRNGNANPHVLIKHHDLQRQNPNDWICHVSVSSRTSWIMCMLMHVLMRYKSRLQATIPFVWSSSLKVCFTLSQSWWCFFVVLFLKLCQCNIWVFVLITGLFECKPVLWRIRFSFNKIWQTHWVHLCFMFHTTLEARREKKIVLGSPGGQGF